MAMWTAESEVIRAQWHKTALHMRQCSEIRLCRCPEIQKDECLIRTRPLCISEVRDSRAKKERKQKLRKSSYETPHRIFGDQALRSLNLQAARQK